MTGAGKRDADSWPPMVLLVKETKPDDNRVDMCVVVAWGSSMRGPHSHCARCIVAARMHLVRGSRKAAMLSCGYRNLWRAQVSTPDQHWSYDEFVMPLLCVCGTRVFIGAAIVTADKGACSMWRSTATVPHTQACRGPAL